MKIFSNCTVYVYRFLSNLPELLGIFFLFQNFKFNLLSQVRYLQGCSRIPQQSPIIFSLVAIAMIQIIVSSFQRDVEVHERILVRTARIQFRFPVRDYFNQLPLIVVILEISQVDLGRKRFVAYIHSK